MKPPDIRYAKSGDVRIAYQVVGQGPLDLVFVPGFISNLEVHWEDPGYAHLMQRLARFTRLIMFDKRGTGLSDRVDAHAMPDLETRMDDVRAVMDAAGSRRAALLGASEGAPMSILFAATHPDRTRALVLYGGYAHFHTGVMPPAALTRFIDGAESSWGSGATLGHFAPGRSDDPHFADWWARFERLSASPTAAITLARMNAQIDVRDVLVNVRVPTLIVHRDDDVRVKAAAGRFLAAQIEGARFVEVPGRDHPIWTGDIDRVVDEIEEFLTGARSESTHRRVLASLMVVRLVAPERLALRIGDHRSSERVERFAEAMHAAALRHGGRCFGTTVHEWLARFDGPARAVRCAIEVHAAAAALDLELAAGVHVGEIETRDDCVFGLALHVASRIAARAASGEILASGIVADLVAGSGLHFVEHGHERFEDVGTSMRLLKVRAEQHLQPAAPTRKSARTIDALSGREREVLELVAQGLSNAAIAQRLQLSDHTVKRHVANILSKLELPNRAAAAALTGTRSAR
jgi:pimeloyl-ACP methyl ester carboxylesterase/DNA-binding CsgD family transcriptional regulator